MAHDVASTRVPRTESSRSVSTTPRAENAARSPSARSGSMQRNLARPLFLVPHRLTPAERYRRISELAYQRAEQRGFTPGGEVDDWLDAEREVDAGRY